MCVLYIYTSCTYNSSRQCIVKHVAHASLMPHVNVLYHIWVEAERPQKRLHLACKAYKEAKKHFRSSLRLHHRTLNDKFTDVHSKYLLQAVWKYISWFSLLKNNAFGLHTSVGSLTVTLLHGIGHRSLKTWLFLTIPPSSAKQRNCTLTHSNYLLILLRCSVRRRWNNSFLLKMAAGPDHLTNKPSEDWGIKTANGSFFYIQCHTNIWLHSSSFNSLFQF